MSTSIELEFETHIDLDFVEQGASATGVSPWVSTAIRDLAAETRGNTVAIRDLSAKLDGVAADLSAHRRDTEAHPPVYRVKE